MEFVPFIYVRMVVYLSCLVRGKNDEIQECI